jgi:hypothetical protein
MKHLKNIISTEQNNVTEESNRGQNHQKIKINDPINHLHPATYVSATRIITTQITIMPDDHTFIL